MALTTTSQVLYDAPRNCVMKFTGYGDGSAQEINVVKVNVGLLTPKCRQVVVRKLSYDIADGSIRLSWEGNQNKDFYIASTQGEFSFVRFGGLLNNATGPTGNILFTTFDAGLSFVYSVTLELQKKF